MFLSVQPAVVPERFSVGCTAAILLGLATGCQDQDYKIGKVSSPTGEAPRIEVTPSVLDFGGLSRGETGVQVVTIESVGDVALELGDIRLAGPDAFTIVRAPVNEVLASGESADLEVAYTPANTEDNGDIYILSNDPSVPEAVVHLYGVGLIPMLQFDPPVLNVGYAPPGSSITGTVDIVNAGGDTLDVSLVAVLGEGFSAEPVPALSLSPGERHPVEITFSPMLEQNYLGEIWAESNTPAGSTRGELQGTSLEKPVAVCTSTPAEPYALYDEVTFDGSDSYVPGGGTIVGYEWALIAKPDGSAVSMPSGAATSPTGTGLVPDLVGDYTAELVVTSDTGEASEPCYTTVSAIPSQDLWVEMYWDHANDDMDLHLLAPGGSLETGSDCYYLNCVGRGLEWGVAGAQDNPSLDIDDIPGTGPENINIQEPEEDVYTVVVHDYQYSTPDYTGENNVTVNIYLSGEKVWTGVKAISGEDSYTYFAEIDVPSQSVAGL
jgi:hypothetical protein